MPSLAKTLAISWKPDVLEFLTCLAYSVSVQEAITISRRRALLELATWLPRAQGSNRSEWLAQQPMPAERRFGEATVAPTAILVADA